MSRPTDYTYKIPPVARRAWPRTPRNRRLKRFAWAMLIVTVATLFLTIEAALATWPGWWPSSWPHLIWTRNDRTTCEYRDHLCAGPDEKAPGAGPDIAPAPAAPAQPDREPNPPGPGAPEAGANSGAQAP